jgi:sugar (pentulose or hexulose) kinase
MKTPVTAIFDIGKTNKKLLLFNTQYEVVFEHEEKFDEIVDDDGFACDDIARIEAWMKTTIEELAVSADYDLKAVNFTTYGASVVYVGEDGKRVGPLYNYLKTIPEAIPPEIYGKYGGEAEFCRKTASPAMGMINSGLQVYWFKKTKPSLFAKVKHILNFPQYLCYLFTGKIVSDYTYLGCHTTMWDFDNMQYHPWMQSEGISMPAPQNGDTSFPVMIKGKEIRFGIGIHDSSASLIPYFAAAKEPFILCSTGTWVVIMNPFNSEPLTVDQLQSGCLCYLSTEMKQVKSSLLFLGYVHDVNVERISQHFKADKSAYKMVKLNPAFLNETTGDFSGRRIFFAGGLPSGHVDETVELSQFRGFDEAYHQLMTDLTQITWEALQMIIPKDDKTKTIYISGGFNRNELFTHLLSKWLPGKEIIASEVKNATALGAAMVFGDGWNV